MFCLLCQRKFVAPKVVSISSVWLVSTKSCTCQNLWRKVSTSVEWRFCKVPSPEARGLLLPLCICQLKIHLVFQQELTLCAKILGSMLVAIHADKEQVWSYAIIDNLELIFAASGLRCDAECSDHFDVTPWRHDSNSWSPWNVQPSKGQWNFPFSSLCLWFIYFEFRVLIFSRWECFERFICVEFKD